MQAEARRQTWSSVSTIVGAFANLWKVTVSFVVSMSAYVTLALTAYFFVKFYIGDFY